MIDLEKYANILTNIGTFLGNIGTFLGSIAAISALTTWKKQIKYKKRYKTIEDLEKKFIESLGAFHKYYYVCLKKMHEDETINSCTMIMQEEMKEFNNIWVAYNFIWIEAKYFLTDNEIANFNYEPHKLHKELIESLPKRGGEINSNGFYTLYNHDNFEVLIEKIFQNGISQIQDFREKKS